MSKEFESKRRRIIVEEEDIDENPDREPTDDESSKSSVNPDDQIDNASNPSDDEEGEDLVETWLADDVAVPELDSYDPTTLADENEDFGESYEDIIRSRRAADRVLNERDRKRKEREEIYDDGLDGIEDADIQDVDREADIEEEDLGEFQDADEQEQGKDFILENFDQPLRDWISSENSRFEIKKRFIQFMKEFYVGIDEVNRYLKRNKSVDGRKVELPNNLKKSPPFYPTQIKSLCAHNRSSLDVNFAHLSEMQSLLAIWLTDVPRDMLNIFNEGLQDIVKEMFPNYRNIAQDLQVRIVGLPIIDKLRDLRQNDLNNLIKVCGVITRRTGVFPIMKSIAYDCLSCGQILGPFIDPSGNASGIRPSACPNCQKSNFKINTQKTEYGNYQKITLQESPGTVPAGRVPRYKDVILTGDLVDIARPGEEIIVTGLYVHSTLGLSKDKNGSPVFSTIIEANSVEKHNVAANIGLTEEDSRMVRELSQDPQIRERIIKSIAPSIYGHRHIKTAIAVSLFGGCQKDGGGTHRVRGDVNVLLLGDPGTAKSQILKYAEKIAPRAVYTAGKGASAVGLTAGVHKDPLTKEWTLEGGALVLADQGVCLIDEFDKMNDQDRTSIHEAMEQQTISVSKAGIVTSLQARCAVIAAANPIGGRYDSSFAFSENVELTDPILQRFDILCVLQDVVDPVIDEKLATFVVNSHHRSHPDYIPRDAEDELGYDEEKQNIEEEDDDGPPPIDQQTLRKYLIYARSFVRPVLHDVDSEKIASLYADLRRQSAISGGVPIAVRHIESVVRIAEASAKMQLRDHVRDDDVDMAIKVMLDSFLQAQKISVRRMLQKSFHKYLSFGEETNHLLMHHLRNLINDAEKYKKLRGFIDGATRTTEVFMSEFENKAKEMGIYDVRPFYGSNLFKSLGMRLQHDKRIGDEPYSDSEALGIQLNPTSHALPLGKKKGAGVFNIAQQFIGSHRRNTYHANYDDERNAAKNPIGAMKNIRVDADGDDDVVYNTHDEFGEGGIGNLVNNLKLVRTGRQRKKQASRSKGSEFQTRRKKRRVYFCCISSEIDIQKLYDFMAGTDSSKNNSSNSISALEHDESVPLSGPSSTSVEFKDWRLKLHNDVVHLYKAGMDNETPKAEVRKRLSSQQEDLPWDGKRALTDDEAMNESANEGNPDTYQADGPFITKKTTFSPNLYENVPTFSKQDSIEDTSYDPMFLPTDATRDEESKMKTSKLAAETSFYDNSWKLSLPKVQEVFVFDFGAAVFWGFARGEEKRLLEVFKMFITRGFVGESEFDRSEDDMGFVISPDVEHISIANEVFTLPDEVSPKQRLSLSFAIAQSSVLAIFESRIEKLIEEYKYIPESMAADGKARLTERQLGTMIGEVFVIRHDVNLHSEILDTPDFFWKQEDIEKDYKMVMNYLEMGARTEVLNKRLDMLRELLDVLQQQMENAHAVKLEWIVIWLIVIEVILQLIAVANEAGWWIY